MPQGALEVFLWVASVCIVLITLLITALSIAVIRTALQLYSLARQVKTQVEKVDSARRTLSYHARVAGKWFIHMLRRLHRFD